MAKQEVKVYLGILLIMGFVELPSYGDYWLTNLILRHHIIPEEGAPLPEDRLWKLRPVVDALNDSFQTTFIPGKEIATDESLWKFRGCCRVHRGDMPSSTKVVLHLMEYGSCLDKGYQLFVDNWYMSPTLFHLLQSQRTNAVGTARLNRKFMP
nr:piggyBac transposable element-derived protein 4-like [Penaeus vannamei]